MKSLFRQLIAVLPAVASGLLLPGVANAQAVGDINFDDLAVGTRVTTQYTAQGLPVLFLGNFVSASDINNPANHVLAVDRPELEFNFGFMAIPFIAPQHLVSLTGTGFFGGNAQQATLVALDDNGFIVSQDGPRLVTGRVFDQVFTVQTAGDIISEIHFQVGSTAIELIDNLHFEGQPAPPTPGDAPIVDITAPPNGTNGATLRVEGTVTGTNVNSTALLQIDYLPPPGQAPHLEFPIALTPGSSPDSFTFSASVAVPPSYATITVRAENLAGLSGTDSINVTNLPFPVTLACPAAGTGAAGTFQYTLIQADCEMIVCSDGGFSFRPSTQDTFSLSSDFLNKWLATQFNGNLGPTQNLGCATGDQARVSGSRGFKQVFQYGRIYGGNPTTTTAYVPNVFAKVIEVDDEGDDRVGIPIADPIRGARTLDVDTYWFQRFERPFPGDLGTTMEIRNNPPVMSVERQGGDLRDLNESGSRLMFKTATIWERHQCTGVGIGIGPWTCDGVVPPPTHVQSPGVIQRARDTCMPGTGGTSELDWPLNVGREWAPMNSDLVFSTMTGWIRPDPHLANIDNPLVHDYSVGCNICGSPDACVGFVGSPPYLRCLAPPSDWIIHVRPFPSADSLLGHNFEDIDVETEMEWYYLQYFVGGAGDPAAGDLAFMAGRWISDCGHTPYRTEIHPHAVFAYAHTVGTLSAPETYLPIFVNGFYARQPTPVIVPLNPPPRPNPNARLELRSNHATGAVIGPVQVGFNIFCDHAEFVIDGGPNQQPSVSFLGEMNFQSGFALEGSSHARWVP